MNRLDLLNGQLNQNNIISKNETAWVLKNIENFPFKKKGPCKKRAIAAISIHDSMKTRGGGSVLSKFGLHVDYTWITRGLHGGYRMDITGFSMDIVWISYGFLDIAWISYGFPLKNLKKKLGLFL